MNKIMIIGALILLVFSGLSGCEENKNNNTESHLIGTWNNIVDDTSITFYSNGNYESTSNIIYDDGTYEIRDNMLVCDVIINNQNVERFFDYDFSKDYTYLSITDTYGQNETFIKS